MNEELDNFLDGFPPDIQSLIVKLRSLVLDIYPTALEQLDVPASLIGYGKDRTYRGMVCAIAPQRKYVNLMFARGTDLVDPEHLLEGTGKRARHIKMRSEADIVRPAVSILLKQAVDLTKGENR